MEFFGHWQRLRPFFQPLVAKLLIPWFALIPIVLTITRDVPKVISIGLREEVSLHLELPFKWWLLWWGSLLYLIAFAIYQIRCPKFIKRYPTYNDYCSHGHSPRWIARELEEAVATTKAREITDELFDRLVTKGLVSEAAEADNAFLYDTTIEKEGTIFWFEYQGRKLKFKASEHSATWQQMEREVFWEVFEPFARSHRASRIIVWALLILAGIAVGVALLQSVWAALPSALESLMLALRSVIA